MTRKLSARWVDRALVLCSYHIGLCKSEKEFNAELRRLKVPERNWPDWVMDGKDATVHYLEKRDGHEQCCLVCVDGVGESPLCVVGLLIHEAVHIWQAHCDDVGESNPGSEMEAYSIQAIAQRLIEAYGAVKAKR